MATCPGVVGGEFRAAIRPDRIVPSPNGYEIELACYTEAKSILPSYSDRRKVPRELLDSMGTAWIPVLFTIPHSAPSTMIGSENYSQNWKLKIHALAANHGYRAEFDVPIYLTDESDGQVHVQPSDNEFVATADPYTRLRASGIGVDESPTGRAFTFPAGRHLGFATAMLVVQACFVVAIGVALFYLWKPGLIPITLMLSFFLLWAIVDVFFYRSQVLIERDRLTVRSGWLILVRMRVVELKDIEDWILVSAGSWGSTTAFNLSVRLKSKATVTLAKRILTEALAKELKSAIKQSR
ncbi:MAG: hypothetical protein SGI77_20995 [Pirellulaceae bacterium]|nr:hypothetical protein [Pirellulaceae bacterium]